jgi:hypothetical protein
VTLRPLFIAALASLLLLAGCDQLGIESATAVADRREAEGKAIGGACRYSGRAIEDCYAINRKADKAAMFAGWREMNDYMRENKMEAVAPQIVPPPGTEVAAKTDADSAADEAPASKKAKSPDKAADSKKRGAS